MATAPHAPFPAFARPLNVMTTCLAALLFSGLVPARSLAEAQIGATETVVNNVTGTMATTRERAVLRAGVDVFQNETIDTADNSASRVLFQDRTELSIGPMSQVLLDRFVFDPNPSNSQVAVSIAKGVARFSTGLLPKPNYKIATPSCTIGIRGTVLTVVVSEAKASTVSVQEGQALVTAQGVTVIVNAGQTTFVAFGKPPTPPTTSPARPPGIATEMDALLQSAPLAAPPPPPPLPFIPYGVYVNLDAGPSFSNTGKFSNADYGNGAHASFGNGYQIGGGVGVRVLPGINLGGEILYTGGLSSTFTSANGVQKATGSAHAETFLVSTQLFPFQLNAPSVAPAGSISSYVDDSGKAPGTAGTGLIQPYVDLGLGFSVATMGELTGHINDVPTGTGPGETKTNFSWKAGAGVQFDTGIPGLTASVTYDYLHIGNFSSTDTFNTSGGFNTTGARPIMRPAFNVNVDENVVTGTLIWHFGAPSGPPPYTPTTLPPPNTTGR